MNLDYGLLIQIGVTIAGISATWAVSRREAEEARKDAAKALEAAEEASKAAAAAAAVAADALKESTRAAATAAASHKRIDAHAERIVTVERDALHAGRNLQEIKLSLEALHKRLDAWFDGRGRTDSRA
jgi:hypothetical protein